MINSELRTYCEDLISHYSKEYPYYFMCTNTERTNNNYYSQIGAVIYFSKIEPTVNSTYSMTSKEWLKVDIYSSNANYNDLTSRVRTSSVNGTVKINEYEYLYSNVNSSYAYATLDTHYNDPVINDTVIPFYLNVLLLALVFAGVVALWLKR